MQDGKGLAVVTGASSGIGLELARLCARDGYDLVIAADDAKIEEAAEALRRLDVRVETVQTDLAAVEGVELLCDIVASLGQRIDLLVANAGHGLGGAFLDQDFQAARHVLDTNVTGTIYLLHRLGRVMRDQGRGRILITGSIAGFLPGTFQAVYNGTKAFIDSFSWALRAELKDSGVSVTCLMPGATETEFFQRAQMLDTRIGQAKKDSAADVARLGYDAVMEGDGDVVTGWKNRLQVAVAAVTPAAVLAEQHRKQAEPGSGSAKRKGNGGSLH